MNPKRINRRSVIGCLVAILSVLGPTRLSAVTAKDITEEEINGIWKDMWGAVMPKVDPMTEAEVRRKMTGKWVCRYGVGPQRLNIVLSKGHMVETSGETESKPWKKTGEWKVIAGKIILFIKEEQLPGYLFRLNEKLFIRDPWSKIGMSEVKRRLDEKTPRYGLTPDRSP